MAADGARRAIETVFRIEWPRLIASLARMTRSIDQAEELAQEALLAALANWPLNGVPRAPGAWLTTVAKRRALDEMRRQRMLERKHDEIACELAHERDNYRESTQAVGEKLGDELLGLIFAACHPAVPTDGQVALTLRLVGGLTTQEIARAFLSTEPTIAQRIVRAKKAIGRAGLAFEVPCGPEQERRLGAVLEVIYLTFNEGYAATTGEELVRPVLCAEAQRLGRVLVALMPEESEAWGLLALMELQASRLAARTGPDGSFVPITEQNRARWDQLLIRRGMEALSRAERLGGADGPYALQAALAACHARASGPDSVDWARIALLYDRLREVVPSPVIDLNRAIAHGMAFGPEIGLRLVGEIEGEAVLRNYAPLPAVKGDLLFRAGRLAEARLHFEAAAGMTGNSREAAFLRGRALECIA